ncbi:cytochrome C assembly family protein [Thalassotalea sp. PLHSN55]|uniref:cytochrome C assembly family protein n=1 Tax=Thalassotalea sp. PLHSN55 TaxID=3435888 RepID=UPI003F83EC74
MDIFSIIAFVFYILATIAIVSRLFHPQGPNLIVALSLGAIAIIAHTLTNSHLLLESHEININLPNVISLVSLIITLTITIVALKFKVNLLLPVVYGFAGIWQLLMTFIPNVEQIPLHAEKLFLISHITLALIAYCVLIIAMLYSFQVAYINFKLKSKNLTAVSHLPPLMQVEQQLFTILAIGTLCLFASELTGFFFIERFFAAENIHKTVLSLISLVIYTIILWGHYSKGWRGNKVLSLTLIATGLLTLSYFGSRFVKEFLLS